MLGNFTFHNPTKLFFGEDALDNLGNELRLYGPKVMLVYGGGSIKRNGIYDAVVAELQKAGKKIVELAALCQTLPSTRFARAWLLPRRRTST